MGRKPVSKWGNGLYGGRNDSTKSRSKVTGKKFNRQNRDIRRHGPNNRKTVFIEAVKWALEEYKEEWVTSLQIAERANNKVPAKWTQLNGYSVGAMMRTHVKNKEVLVQVKNNVKYFKLIKLL